MIDPKRVHKDHKFILANPQEYGTTQAGILRNLIALNLDMTRAEWVTFAVAKLGVNKGTANNRYSETQKAWAED